MPLQTESRFFLTKHSANILEDLHRRINQMDSFSLLYGAKGVGKSRLLSHFFKHRLPRENAVFVQFDSMTSFSVNMGEAVPFESFFKDVIEKLTLPSMLLIDQFDNAPDELQQKIIKFWATQEKDKGSNLIVSIQKSSLQQFQQLSKRFYLSIDSAELKPLSNKDQLEFVGSNGCSNTRQSVVLSSSVKKDLMLTKGLFLPLDAFRTRYQDDLCCENIHISRWFNVNKRLILGLLILALSLVVVQYKDISFEVLKIWTPLSDASELVSDQNEKNSVLSGEVSMVTEKTLDQNSHPVAVKNLQNDSIVSTIPKVESPEEFLEQQGVSTEPLMDVGESDLERPDFSQQSDLTLLQQRLQATANWLASVDKKSTSIQLMTIDFKENTVVLLERYFTRLKQKQLDLDSVKVYPVNQKGRKMYAVLYGEFKDSMSASRAIKLLPVALKANKPFPRKLKGIINEAEGFK